MKRLKCAAIVACAATLAVGTLCLAACSPATNENPAANAADAADTSAVAWSMDGDCTTCHATEAASTSDSSCLAALHANNPCTTCHADASTLENVHKTATADGKMPTKLKKSQIAQDACLSCHDGADGLAKATANSTVLTDGQGNVANPHALPESESHATIACGDCHSMHSEDNVTEAAPQACVNCHHENVYECGTCHE